MTVSSSCLSRARFREPFDRGKSPVPLRGEVSYDPSGLVEAVGFYHAPLL
jgi:hypothetical protein